jgi:hypothetical protein
MRVEDFYPVGLCATSVRVAAHHIEKIATSCRLSLESSGSCDFAWETQFVQSTEHAKQAGMRVGFTCPVTRLIRSYQILVMLRTEVGSMLADDGGENDASLKAVAGAVSVFGNRICFGLELFRSANRG